MNIQDSVPPIVSPMTDPRSRRRFEDARFLTGAARYADDEAGDGQLVAVLLRSPHAHAHILSIDTTLAMLPGVRGIFTAASLQADGIGPLPCTMDLRDGQILTVPRRYPLAETRVRHVGDPVALVVAERRAVALDALELIAVDYDPLPAVIDPAQARQPEAPQLWPEAPGNVAFRFRRGDAARTEALLAEAAHVVTLSLINNRIAAVAMEPRVATGRWDAARQRYQLRYSGASMHVVRRELAESVFGVPPEHIEVDCPDTGGGFGMKSITYPEYALVLWAARRLGAPVRWTAERSDDFLGGAHGRANVTTARLGLDATGRFLALAVETTADLGAYVSTGGPGSSTFAPATAQGGLYAIPAISMDVHGVFTNTVPIDAYRGAGKPEANYIIERLADIAARRLGLTPADIRRRNLIGHFPYRTAMGLTIDCGDPLGHLERALAASDYEGFAARRTAAAERGKLRGIGLGCFLETSRGQPNEEAWLRLTPDGVIDVAVGTQPNGQGHETSFVQLVADRLSLPMQAFRFLPADTRRIPRGGSYGGARSLHMGGAALLLAADDLLAKARPLAARLLQVSPEALRYTDGAFQTAAGTGSLGLAALAHVLAQSGEDVPDGHGDNRCDIFTFPHGCHVAEVEIDPETGDVTLLRYMAADDYGRLLNPMLTVGQVHGGLAQGIGQALTEAIHYDPESGQLISASLMDYQVPRGDDLPWLDILLSEAQPTRANPMGSKGAGQAGAIAAPQVVMNAVVDALAPLGVEHIDMPATPHRVWQAIREVPRR
jgi:aerobic carbon-monoxide dehydrogenase large subunit